MNHTKTVTLILLTLLTATSGMATAQNRTEKRPRKLSTKKQLVIERQRADSLAALVEEYRRRESDWQKAWHDAQEQDERHHHVEQFAVDYAQDYPEPEAILAAGLAGAKIEEVPVQMRERQGGVSSINPVRSVYYMIKVSLALILFRFTRGRGRRDD